MKSISIIILLFISFCTFAQKPSLVFHHISVDDGLSENTVRAIIEDQRGFIWFGCEDGLNKFDGYEFKIYRNDNDNLYSISSRNIKFLYVDSKGNLWVLTSSGLNVYDPVRDRFYNHKNDTYVSLKPLSGDISGITEDKDGNIWVATVYDGLFKIEALNKPAIKINSPYKDDSQQLVTVKQDSDSTLLVGTKDGLLRYNFWAKTFSDLRPVCGNGYEIRTIFIDKFGALYLSTNKGLKVLTATGILKEYSYNPKNITSINGDNIINVVPYNDGNYLVGIDGGGIDYFDVKKEKFYHYSEELSSPNINCLYTDTKGDIWAGTFLNGVNYSNATTNLFVLDKLNKYSDHAIKKGIVSSFYKDSRGNFWVTTDGGGLYKKNKGSDIYKHYEAGSKGLTNNVIISIIEDKEGYMWLSSYGGGLFRYDNSKDEFTSYNYNFNDPNSLFNDHTKALCEYRGKLWVSGFGSGIGVLDKTTNKFKNYVKDEEKEGAFQSNWVQSFYIDKQDVLWIASFAGLVRYNSNRDSFTTFKFKNRLSNNHVDINSIIDIIEDENGTLWLATTGNGIIAFDKHNYTYINYTTKDGLSNNYIKSIIEDNESTLWIASNNGITKFDIKTKKAKAYTVKDGIPPCSFFFNAKYKDENGVIYLGTNKGILKINPANTGKNKLIPPVYITSFELFNEEVIPGTPNSPLEVDISETKKITLAYNQNTITFHFAALNFNSSRNNKYAYYLEGFDKNWFMVGDQRTAKYTNLNPGTYVFRVKGSNNDQVWNEKGISVIIKITAPFWKTWWFIFAVGLMIVFLLYLIYIWRTKVIRNKNISLEKLISERTNDLEEANQRLETFVYKASHDIKGPLKSIIGLTTIGQKDVKDDVAKTYFDHILHSTKKLDSLLMDLLMVTKVRQTELKSELIHFDEMVRDILVSFENLPNYKTINITTEITSHANFYSDKKMLHSVVQNLIENPIKYQDPNKDKSYLLIKITVSKSGQVEMIFKDNGLGIKHDAQKNIFDMFFKANENSNGTGLGLYIVKSTVEKLKGTIRLDSEEGIGSTFYVNF